MTGTIEKISEQRCFEGIQGFYRHASAACAGPMRFAVFQPPQAQKGPVPVLYYLAGLTCTEENFTIKAGAQRVAAELGLMLVMPDTSPRNTEIPGIADDFEFGNAAGFYLDATQAPYSKFFNMYTYVTEELPGFIAASFPADMARQGIFGHSMGGHGALTIALKNPDRYRSASAFAPIASPMRCPWGEKALSRYLGDDREAWRDYDTTALIQSRGWRGPPLIVDQGTSDPFIDRELKPELLRQACADAGVALDLRLRDGYDHSYFFIATFIEEHLRFHARHIGA